MARKKKQTPGSPKPQQNASSPSENAAEKEVAKIAAHESGRPGGGAGRRDVVEPIPDNIRVDPYITEGHPGYEESGESEIIPLSRLSGGASQAPSSEEPGESE